MKKNILFLVFLTLSSFVASVAFGADPVKVVAANYSDRYHLPSCKVAQKIAPEDLLTFNSPEDASAKGLVPCKKCNPPAPKGTTADKKNFAHSSKEKHDQDS